MNFRCLTIELLLWILQEYPKVKMAQKAALPAVQVKTCAGNSV